MVIDVAFVVLLEVLEFVVVVGVELGLGGALRCAFRIGDMRRGVVLLLALF